MMPMTPYVAGVIPVMTWSRGVVRPSAALPGCDGGMKGDQLSRLMNWMPAKMTKSTMKSLTPTSTRLTRSDSLMPHAMSSVRPAMSRKAGRSKCDPGPTDSGHVTPSCPRKVTKYCDHPWATTLAPSMSSRSRSQPMIHATSSPSVA